MSGSEYFNERLNAYQDASIDPNASREERVAKLKVELREHVRSFGDYKLLSVDWLKMAESLQQVSNVAYMEKHMPSNDSNAAAAQGKKSEGTLWDQQKDELAIRILLEEGKLNLCLRTLQHFKEEERKADFHDVQVSVGKSFGVDLARVVERCKTFERALGAILRLAFNHVEALQILDVPNLVQHCAQCLTTSLASESIEPPFECEKMQDALAVQYLSCLAACMEQINEDRVMELLAENDIFRLLIALMTKHANWFRAETHEAFVKFLNQTMGSEAYITDSAQFISVDMKKQLVKLHGVFIDRTVRSFPERKTTQHLQDNMNRFLRQFPA